MTSTTQNTAPTTESTESPQGAGPAEDVESALRAAPVDSGLPATGAQSAEAVVPALGVESAESVVPAAGTESAGAVGAAERGVPVKRRRNRAAREREILEAAERIFGERGYQGTSMDDVAAEVGVSKPLIYQYYGSKDGLFLACLARLRIQLLDTVSDAVMAAPDAEDALYAGFVAWFEFLDDHPQAWSVLIDEGMLGMGPAAGPAAAATDEVRAAFIELISAMVRMNLPSGRAVDEDEIQIVAQSISGATERLAIWRSRIPAPPTPEKVARTLQDLLWQGLQTLRHP